MKKKITLRKFASFAFYGSNKALYRFEKDKPVVVDWEFVKDSIEKYEKAGLNLFEVESFPELKEEDDIQVVEEKPKEEPKKRKKRGKK